MTEKDGTTARTLVHLHSEGDIVLSAPKGRVHIQSQFFSREVSAPPPATAAAPVAQAAAAPPAPEHASGVVGFFSGLYDSTLKPLGHMVMHPIDTAEGIGHAVAHPGQTLDALGHAIKSTGQGIASGDGYAMGTAVGSVGMFFVPGADVAEGAEDAARLGQVGEVVEASDVARLSDVAPVSEAVTTPGASRIIPGEEPDFNPTGSGTNCGACSTSVDNYLSGKDFAPAPEGLPAWPESAPADGAWTFGTSPTDIESSLKASGEGSQGIVHVQDGDYSHVFNAYNSDGQIMAYDGQNGAAGSIESVAGASGYKGPGISWGFHPTGPGK